MNTFNLFVILLPSILTFLIGIFISYPLTSWLYKNKIWKKKNVHLTIDGKPAEISSRLHNDENVKTPRMGGLIIWVSVLATASLFYLLARLTGLELFEKLDFTSRSQTWLPLASLLFGGVLGAIDDLSVVEYFKSKGSYIGGGLSLKIRLLFVFLISLFVGYWFIYKLGMNSFTIPFLGSVVFPVWSLWIILVVIMMATYAGGVIDGVDGLSGGVMMSIYSAYGVIALIGYQYNIAALCFAIASGILAFLWFNIPPARFYCSETGMTALLLTLVVIAYLVDGVAYLPFIAFPLYMTVASVVIQLLSKKIRGKKVFLVAPIHHHFEAIGWPSYKVAMRYWILAYFCAIFGVLLSLI
ncbi:MAG: Phospho-N-acetylmuramoyl-pentapeptide-transferase [Patescibacteria group bacterium]|nr:Phospho-N-acetylmuramoyl-pentapeptide-transferase [Patescibacteria group bacterium]